MPGHCSFLIKARILLFVTRQMELEIIMISDTHRKQKNKYCVIILTEGICQVESITLAGGVRRRE